MNEVDDSITSYERILLASSIGIRKVRENALSHFRRIRKFQELNSKLVLVKNNYSCSFLEREFKIGREEKSEMLDNKNCCRCKIW